MSKQNKGIEETANQIIDTFLDEFPYGYWDGVCDCCTGFENTEDAMTEHFKKGLIKAISQAKQEQIERDIEVMKGMAMEIPDSIGASGIMNPDYMDGILDGWKDAIHHNNTKINEAIKSLRSQQEEDKEV